jgi:hypothetical protein
MNIEAKQFLTGSGRRVLTNEGRQGMGGVAGVGSSTEKMLGYVAEAVLKTAANWITNSSMTLSAGYNFISPE